MNTKTTYAQGWAEFDKTISALLVSGRGVMNNSPAKDRERLLHELFDDFEKSLDDA